MEIRQLHHFLALIEHRKFHQAAAAVNLTQPALSKSIRKLEEFFGAPLFDRSRQGVTLTPLGEAIARHARMILTEIRYASDAATSVRTGAEGEVTVGVVLSLTGHLLPMAVASLAEQSPGIQLRVVAGLNDFLFESLRNGHVDLVVSAIPDPPHREKDLTHEILFSDRVSVVARAHHPLMSKSKQNLEDLQAFPWVLFGTGVLSRQHLNGVYLTAGLSPPGAAIESNDSTFTKSMVLRSNFLTYVPYQVVRSELQAGDLVTVQVPGSVWQRQVGLTFRKRGSRSAVVARLADEIRAAAKRLEPHA